MSADIRELWHNITYELDMRGGCNFAPKPAPLLGAKADAEPAPNGDAALPANRVLRIRIGSRRMYPGRGDRVRKEYAPAAPKLKPPPPPKAMLDTEKTMQMICCLVWNQILLDVPEKPRGGDNLCNPRAYQAELY